MVSNILIMRDTHLKHMFDNSPASVFGLINVLISVSSENNTFYYAKIRYYGDFQDKIFDIGELPKHMTFWSEFDENDYDPHATCPLLETTGHVNG